MVITVNGAAINLDLDTILIWILVGLVAGFLASHIALGHGLGLFGDILAGIAGAFVGGILAAVFHVDVHVIGHPIISQIVVAFAGAAILLLVLRLFAPSRRRAFSPPRRTERSSAWGRFASRRFRPTGGRPRG